MSARVFDRSFDALDAPTRKSRAPTGHFQPSNFKLITQAVVIPAAAYNTFFGQSRLKAIVTMPQTLLSILLSQPTRVAPASLASEPQRQGSSPRRVASFLCRPFPSIHLACAICITPHDAMYSNSSPLPTHLVRICPYSHPAISKSQVNVTSDHQGRGFPKTLKPKL